jgi:lambda repressor-like predicted transcriptional regulator
MPFDGLPKQQLEHARQAVYISQRINPRNDLLVRDKLRLATEQRRKGIKEATADIRFDNRSNLNETGVERAVSKMWEQKVDDYAGKCYEILGHHWNLRGEKKTSAFVNVALGILLRKIEQLGQSAACEAKRRHIARGAIGTSPAGLYENSARAVCERWKSKLDIEARELDLVAASGKISLEHAGRMRVVDQPRQSLEISSTNSRLVSASKRESVEKRKHERKSQVLSLLRDKGWSINDWAVQSDVDFHTADSYLKGRRNPYPSTRNKLAKSLGIRVEDLPS